MTQSRVMLAMLMSPVLLTQMPSLPQQEEQEEFGSPLSEDDVFILDDATADNQLTYDILIAEKSLFNQEEIVEISHLDIF